MSDELELIEHRGLTIKIYPDDSPESPREWDNLGVMVCWHRREEYGDEQVRDEYGGGSRFRSIKQIERFLRIARHAVVVLPLGLIDHSGVSMYIGGVSRSDPGGWDSGQVGFIYVTREKLIAEYGIDETYDEAYGSIIEGRRWTETLDKAEEVLRGEVETYDQWLRGDVYGYVVEDREGEHLDSCWGFYGMEDTIREAKGAADHYANTRDARANAQADAAWESMKP